MQWCRMFRLQRFSARTHLTVATKNNYTSEIQL
jgi:hypothetical protein